MQENHLLEAAYLDHFSTTHGTENKCLMPYHQQTEFEADLLYSFKNFDAAHAAFIDNCHYRNEEDSYYHPSTKKRCQAAYRAFKMLEIEKSLKEKQKTT